MQNSHASESDDDVDDIDDMFYDYSNSSDGKLYHISHDIIRAGAHNFEFMKSTLSIIIVLATTSLHILLLCNYFFLVIISI